MDRNKTRYKKMETIMTAILCLDAVVFVAYLVFAGIGMVGLKVTAAVLCLLISVAVLYFLFMTRELLRRRSIWMTVAALCVIVCVLASLILHFPAPVYTLPQA